jgi:nucleolar protein 4
MALNGTLVDGQTVAVDWAIDKDVWEKQIAEAEKNENADISDALEGVKIIVSKEKLKKKKEAPKPTEGGEDDVANFFKNFGDQLESEDKDDEPRAGGHQGCRNTWCNRNLAEL